MTSMKVPLLDLKYKTIKKEVLKTAEELFESQYFILGPRVTDLEEKIADYCSSSRLLFFKTCRGCLVRDRCPFDFLDGN